MMCFEIKERDLAGKIGILKTRRGSVETPYVMPVVNPIKNTIKPSELLSEFKLNMIITNSYIIFKNYGREAKDVHGITGFDGVIMTDSGAYQLLVYGAIDVSPGEILEFQEKIKSDIGVILDIPTGGGADRKSAEYTVMETLRRAQESISLRKDETMLWAGPIQGGRFLDLVETCAERMGQLDFHIHPLGSPTQIMENYDYSTLVDMIVASKRKLPPERPFHLFGAGHPMMLSLAVALGCDLFDSAAYALFAKDGRYMTQNGTIRIENLEELPCCCPVCSRYDVEHLMELDKKEREVLLAKHNLHMVIEEVKTIKEAIREGRLWELLEMRCRSHPRLYEGFKRILKYSKYLEEQDPIVSRRGIFFYDHLSMNRPEVIRYKSRLEERYEKPEEKEVLLLLPMPNSKPFNRSKIFKKAIKKAEENVHICFYGDPFGIIPSELAETFPLSQFESSLEDMGAWKEEAKKFARNYREAIILGDEIDGFKSIKSIDELKVKG